ncbi:tRNA1(Val) (adenine(37)-N6)-methyltransferase [Humidesulfovibrio sp.]
MHADATTRRARFPRGLAQPEGGFRFGADTLLLAAFAHANLKHGTPLNGLDLGTGCGAASLGLLLLRPQERLRLTGIDTGPEMLDAARQNAASLGLAEDFQPLLADVQDYRPAPPGLDFALANPPFRVAGTGKSSPDLGRNRARFEGPGGFAAFAACAGRSLRPRAPLFLVHLAERLPELICALADAGLPTRRVLPVQGHAGQPPRLVLLMATRGRGTGLALDCPLVLYDTQGELSQEALAFCPHLAANPTRKPPQTGG